MFFLCCCEKGESTGMDAVHTMPAINDTEKHEIVENTLEMNDKKGSFTVNVRLPEMYLRHLGVELDDVDDRGPMLMTITSGVIDTFNTENPTKAMKPFDCITAVNGKTGDKKLLLETLKAAMKSSEKSLHLTLARPTPYKIILEKSSLRLGAQLNYKPSSRGSRSCKNFLPCPMSFEMIAPGWISLAQIADGGRFDKWNQDNPDVIVKVGDRIIEVNGVRMLGGEMLGELKKQDEDLTLTLLRY
ncbi:unnamed protein product [Durusdinium trenchii]|uniref:PDZ domain-containing protein n=1 Tax=Durusdinium trenchii TaxID=1381693 RepID=A0ABP0K6P6_9DINO